MLELEGSYAWHASAAAVGLSAGTAHTGVIGFWIVALLALIGAVTPAARRAPYWLWGFPLLLVLTVVFVNVETPRFREPVDPFLILLAACAIGWAIERALGLSAHERRELPGRADPRPWRTRSEAGARAGRREPNDHNRAH